MGVGGWGGNNLNHNLRIWKRATYLLTYTGVGNVLSDTAFKKTTATVAAVHTVMLPVAFVATDFARYWHGQRSS